MRLKIRTLKKIPLMIVKTWNTRTGEIVYTGRTYRTRKYTILHREGDIVTLTAYC